MTLPIRAGNSVDARTGRSKRQPWMRLSPAVAASGVLVIALTVASAMVDIADGRAAAVQSTLRELLNLSRALAEQTVRSIQAVDVLVRETARDPLFADARRPADDRALFRRLRRSIATMPQVRELQIVGPDGRLEYRTAEFPAEHLSLLDCDCFLEPRSGPSARILLTRTSRLPDGAGTLALSERMESPHGALLGVVIATLDLEYFERFYQALGLQPGSTVVLYERDGAVLARYPPGEGGNDVAATGADPLPALPAGGTAVLHGPGGVRKLFAAQPVAETSLLLGVELDEGVALAAWARNARHIGLRTALLASVLGVLVALVVRQLEQRERAAALLRESEERYALAMAGSSAGHWDWDLRARRIYLSARLLALIGLTGGERVTDDRWIDREGLVHGEDRAPRRAALFAHLLGRTPYYECEYRVRHGDGEYRWLLDRGLGLRDRRGRVYRMAGAIADITARKRAEAERARLEQRLHQAEKLEALGTLAAGIAHDFNNILGAITGYAEMAVQAAPADGPLRRYASNMMLGAERAQDLVDQILAYSRSSRGRRELVDLRKVIAEALELLRPMLPAGVRLDVNVDAARPSVIGDPTNLHQVVMNLCTNAIHATPQGGVVALQLSEVVVQAERALLQGSLPPGRYLRLSVSDTGIGIPADQLPRVFEPFFTTKEPGSGTGLGLALVQGIVADIGGAIDVSSTQGAGSTFDVYMPACDAREKGCDEHPGLPQGAGERVMLVVDDPAMLGSGEEMLALLGYDPAGFRGPQAAIDALIHDASGFDALVVIDQPGGAGTELARWMRSAGKEWPVLLVRAPGVPGSPELDDAPGRRIVLFEPLSAAMLAPALAQLLSSPASRNPRLPQ